MSLLTVAGVSMHFGGLRALDGVDLEVRQGEILGIIGPNGSGKTTLFNVLTGLYRATAGSVLLEGQQLVGLEAHAIARMGVARTFQHSRLLQQLSVRDNILLGYYGHRPTGLIDAVLRRGRMKQEVAGLQDQAAELVRFFSPALAGRFADRVGSLPYLDRRRVEICRALAAGARLILLDEPTAGLNPEETHELIEDLRKVQSDRPGMTIIIIEHDMSVIGGVSDRVACLNYGKKIAEGSFEAVVQDPEVRSAYLGGDAIA